jgi:hypothetical protein
MKSFLEHLLEGAVAPVEKNYYKGVKLHFARGNRGGKSSSNRGGAAGSGPNGDGGGSGGGDSGAVSYTHLRAHET